MAFGTLKADTLTHSTAGSLTTDYVVNGSAKGWARHTTVSSSSIVDSFNMASLTDAGTGETSFALTNSMSDANYAVEATAGRTSASNPGECWIYSGNMVAGGLYQVETLAAGDGSYQDQDYVAHSVMGDLA
jgi:hypothetical protein